MAMPYYRHMAYGIWHMAYGHMDLRAEELKSWKHPNRQSSLWSLSLWSWLTEIKVQTLQTIDWWCNGVARAQGKHLQHPHNDDHGGPCCNRGKTLQHKALWPCGVVQSWHAPRGSIRQSSTARAARACYGALRLWRWLAMVRRYFVLWRAN